MKITRREGILTAISAFVTALVPWMKVSPTKWWEREGYKFNGVPVNFGKITIDGERMPLVGFQDFTWHNLHCAMDSVLSNLPFGHKATSIQVIHDDKQFFCYGFVSVEQNPSV